MLAWARLAESAREDARRCDEEQARGHLRGPLHGIPIAIKDNFDTAGLATEAGSAMMADRVPTRDAESVRRLRAAGAIVLGKTAMTEFAAMDPAPTRNPWNIGSYAWWIEQRLCGGGRGAHVRRRDRHPDRGIDPAACRLLRRMRPETDLRGGIAGWRHCLCVVHGPRRTDRDGRHRFSADVRRPQRPRAATAEVGDQPVVGVPDRGFEPADASVAEAFDHALETLAKAGARIVPVRLPTGFEALAAAGIMVMYAEMAAFHRDRLAERRREFPPRLLVLVEEGAAISAADYINAQTHPPALKPLRFPNCSTASPRWRRQRPRRRHPKVRLRPEIGASTCRSAHLDTRP